MEKNICLISLNNVYFQTYYNLTLYLHPFSSLVKKISVQYILTLLYKRNLTCRKHFFFLICKSFEKEFILAQNKIRYWSTAASGVHFVSAS